MGGVLRTPPLHVVLLAGGSGTRFWPLSRERLPKQLLALAGERSLLRETFTRALSLAPPRRIWAVAPASLADAVRREIRELPRRNLVVEPSPRNTAPAIALASATLERLDPGALAAFLPTDHAVADTRAFSRAVRAAAAVARDGAVVCLGVKPDRPATGFGWLRLAHGVRDEAVPVTRFVEKPDAARASRFLRSGRYLWNGGMLVAPVRKILDEVGRHAPLVHAAATATAGGRPRAWFRAPRISFDHAVLEKARGILAVRLDAGWDDVGSWEAAARLLPGGNARDVLTIDSPGAAVFGGERLVALVGLRDVVVVDTEDALLLVAKGHGERVREIVGRLRDASRLEVL